MQQIAIFLYKAEKQLVILRKKVKKQYRRIYVLTLSIITC